MSWSVAAKGETPGVGEIIDKQFADGSKCPEPEETIRQSARNLIAGTVGAQSPGTKLVISAYGSQSTSSQGEGLPDKITVSLAIKIDIDQ